MAMILVGVLMGATALVLLVGMGMMIAGGEINRKYANKMMVARVSLQALTIATVGVLMLIGK